MDWQQVVIKEFDRLSQLLDKAIDGLTEEELNWQPNPDCNNMGWLVWHLSRGQDKAVWEITGEEQLWVKDRWYDKFNRQPDPDNSGFSHSSEDIAGFKSPDYKTLLGYYHAVQERSKNTFNSLSSNDLDNKIDNPFHATTGIRIAAILYDNLQHAGQVAYLRGLLKGKGWLGV